MALTNKEKLAMSTAILRGRHVQEGRGHSVPARPRRVLCSEDGRARDRQEPHHHPELG